MTVWIALAFDGEELYRVVGVYSTEAVARAAAEAFVAVYQPGSITFEIKGPFEVEA